MLCLCYKSIFRVNRSENLTNFYLISEVTRLGDATLMLGRHNYDVGRHNSDVGATLLQLGRRNLGRQGNGATQPDTNICTRDRSNYMRLQRCTGILVYKWLCTVQSVPELGKGVERTKIQGCHFILQVKFYTRPTRYRKILLIADSEKNNK